MEWFSVPVNLVRDPTVRCFDDQTFRGWIEALADVATHETDGRLVVRPRDMEWANELIQHGALLPTEEANAFEVYAWSQCVKTKAYMAEKREQGRLRKQRWQERNAGVTQAERVTERVTPAFGSTSLSTSTSRSTNGSQLPTSGEPANGRRDLAYEAFGDVWQGDWHGLPDRTRGRINEALGSLRNMTENRERSDDDLGSEVRRRWAHAIAWHPEWDWTPQTFVNYWRKLANPVSVTAGASASEARIERIAKEAGA